METTVTVQQGNDSIGYRDLHGPWSGKVFSDEDILEFWKDNIPEFKSDDHTFTYVSILNNIEERYFQELIGKKLDQSIRRLEDLISKSSDPRFAMIRTLDELVQYQKAAELHIENEWEGFFLVPTVDALRRIILLIDILKSMIATSINKVESSHRPVRIASFKKVPDLKDVLMLARIPILMWGLKFDDDDRQEYFKLFASIYGVKSSKQPDSNISDALANLSYHDCLKELLVLIKDYALAFDAYERKHVGTRKVKKPGNALTPYLKEIGLS